MSAKLHGIYDEERLWRLYVKALLRLQPKNAFDVPREPASRLSEARNKQIRGPFRAEQTYHVESPF